MYLKDLAKVIYTKGTCDENRHITIKTEHSAGCPHKVLWEGKAKELSTMQNIGGWIVVEILVDRNIKNEEVLPDYNKGKIITVI